MDDTINTNGSLLTKMYDTINTNASVLTKHHLPHFIAHHHVSQTLFVIHKAKTINHIKVKVK